MNSVRRLTITGATVVTMDPTRHVFSPGVIVIEDGRIVTVGPENDLGAAVDCDSGLRLHKPGFLAIPGLINVHTHVSEILLRGSASPDRELYDWQWNLTYPSIRAYTDADAYTAALLFSVDAIRSGTTAVVDNANTGYSVELVRAALRAYQEAGLRAVLARVFACAPLVEDNLQRLAEAIQGRGMRLSPSEMLEPIDDVFVTLEDLMQEYPMRTGSKLAVWPAPHKPNRTSLESIARSYELVDRYGGMVSQPCSEIEAEATLAGLGAIDFLRRQALLGPRTLLGHAVHVTAREIRAVKETGACLAHLPVANLYLGSGVAPFPAFLARGITVGLGTDNANCNDSVNLFREMTVCALLHKGVQRDAGAITAAQVFAAVTCDAARAIGAGDRLGSLEPGKQADIVLINTARSHLTPLHDPVGTIVYQANGSEVDTVLIEGEILLAEGVLTFLDGDGEAELRSEAQRRSVELLARVHTHPN